MGGEGKSHRKKKAGRKAEKRKAAASKKRQDGGESAAGALSTEQVGGGKGWHIFRSLEGGQMVHCQRSLRAPLPRQACWCERLCSSGQLLDTSFPWPAVPCEYLQAAVLFAVPLLLLLLLQSRRPRGCLLLSLHLQARKQNPKAFIFSSKGKAKLQRARTAEKEQRRMHGG